MGKVLVIHPFYSKLSFIPINTLIISCTSSVIRMTRLGGVEERQLR